MKVRKYLFIPIVFVCFFACNITISKAQDKSDIRYWSADSRLNAEDFKATEKIDDDQNRTCYAEFTWEYSVSKVDFITRNFNRKVRHGIVQSQSWINPSTDINLSLRYLQTLFDINEIYAREFRKELRTIRNKLTKNIELVDELNDKITAERTKRKALYESETNSGEIEEVQKNWEEQIKKELSDLSEYSYENW